MRTTAQTTKPSANGHAGGDEKGWEQGHRRHHAEPDCGRGPLGRRRRLTEDRDAVVLEQIGGDDPVDGNGESGHDQQDRGSMNWAPPRVRAATPRRRPPPTSDVVDRAVAGLLDGYGRMAG
jgi:hypothetical protein